MSTAPAHPPAPQVFAVRYGAATSTGRHRADNQDAHLARPPVFVVADGMGGHRHGREAATAVVEAFDEAVTGDWVSPHEVSEGTARAAARVAALGQAGPGSPGSTVTGVGMALHEGRPAWLVFNVGDSRTYTLRSGRLRQVTVDHSRLQELVDGGLSVEEASRSGAGHVITRAIGAGSGSIPDVDQWLLPARAGDRLLLCSDGLTGELTDQLIGALLETTADAGEAARALVDAAVAAGGHDNVTVVVVDAVTVDGSHGGPGDAPDDGPDDGLDTTTLDDPSALADADGPGTPAEGRSS